MKYVAKYCLAKGEIDIGDYYIQLSDRKVHKFNSYSESVRSAVNKSDNYIKVKLCIYGISEDDSISKLLGEISPDALEFVKENGEFDKEQLKKFIYFTRSDNHQDIDYSHNVNDIVVKVGDEREVCDKMLEVVSIDKTVIRIKGPCGHYH